MCTLLASVLGRVPTQILRSKFNASVQVMQQIVEQSDQQVYFIMLVATAAMQQSAMLPISPAIHCCCVQWSITRVVGSTQTGSDKCKVCRLESSDLPYTA